MRNHLTAVLPIYYRLLVKLQSLFGIIKVEIHGKENWRKKNFTQESNKLLHLYNNEGTRVVCFSAISPSVNKITDQKLK